MEMFYPSVVKLVNKTSVHVIIPPVIMQHVIAIQAIIINIFMSSFLQANNLVANTYKSPIVIPKKKVDPIENPAYVEGTWFVLIFLLKVCV